MSDLFCNGSGKGEEIFGGWLCYIASGFRSHTRPQNIFNRPQRAVNVWEGMWGRNLAVSRNQHSVSPARKFFRNLAFRGYPRLYPFYNPFTTLYCPFFISFLVTFPVMLILPLQGLSRGYKVPPCDAFGHSGISFFVHTLLTVFLSFYAISKGYPFFTVDSVSSSLYPFLGRHCQPLFHGKPLSINVLAVKVVKVFVNLGNPFSWKRIHGIFAVNGHGASSQRGRSLFIVHKLKRAIIDNGTQGIRVYRLPPPAKRKQSVRHHDR